MYAAFPPLLIWLLASVSISASSSHISGVYPCVTHKHTHWILTPLSACLSALVVQGSVAPGGSYVNKLFYGSLTPLTAIRIIERILLLTGQQLQYIYVLKMSFYWLLLLVEYIEDGFLIQREKERERKCWEMKWWNWLKPTQCFPVFLMIMFTCTKFYIMIFWHILVVFCNIYLQLLNIYIFLLQLIFNVF